MNQLLTLLDGTKEMNNILVVALTNRKDMLDPALLRPGRLEVHLEIRPPTAQGRREILLILFAPLVQESYLTIENRDKWIPWIERRTDGANGADLSGVMRNAAAHAIQRWQKNHAQRSAALLGEANVQILEKMGNSGSSLLYIWDDFDQALHALED